MKRDQSPPVTPITDVTRFGTHSDGNNDLELDKSGGDDESYIEERAAEFVFPTRHFVSANDVELHSVDLK